MTAIGDHSRFFPCPEQEVRCFCLAPAHVLGMGMPRPKSRVPCNSRPHPHPAPGAACSSRSSQRPPLRLSGALPRCRPAGPGLRLRGRRRTPLTCSAAWRSRAAHLHNILEHPFFSATAARAVTSAEAGPTPSRDAVGASGRWWGGGRGRGAGKTLEVPCGEEREAAGWAPASLFHTFRETNSAQRGESE